MLHRNLVIQAALCRTKGDPNEDDRRHEYRYRTKPFVGWSRRRSGLPEGSSRRRGRRTRCRPSRLGRSGCGMCGRPPHGPSQFSADDPQHASLGCTSNRQRQIDDPVANGHKRGRIQSLGDCQIKYAGQCSPEIFERSGLIGRAPTAARDRCTDAFLLCDAVSATRRGTQSVRGRRAGRDGASCVDPGAVRC